MKEEEKEDPACIKDALFKVFALPPSEANEQFVAQKLCLGESVAVYMAVLQKLAWLFREQPKRDMVYSLLARHSLQVKELLQPNSSIDILPWDQLLEHAQTIRKNQSLQLHNQLQGPTWEWLVIGVMGKAILP